MKTTRFGGYFPKSTDEEMELVRYLAREAMGNRAPFSGPCELLLGCFFAVPTSWPHRKRQEALSRRLRHIKRPDASNIQKLVEDALLGIVFNDDSQICDWRGWKRYSTEPRVVVQVRELSDNDENKG